MRGVYVRSLLEAYWSPLVALALYTYSLPPGIGWWDTGEFQTVPYIAGILHQTGFPAYSIVGWLFSHIVAIGNVAWRMSLLSAVCGAVATERLAYVARRLGGDPWVAGGVALVFVTSPLIWAEMTRASVEPLALACASVALAAAVRYAFEPRLRTLVAVGVACVVTFASHPISMWTLPGIALIALVAGGRRPKLRDVGSTVLVSVALGLLIFAYLPLRDGWIVAHQLDPAENLLGLTGLPFWDYDRPQTYAGFIRLVTGASFGAASSLTAPFELTQYPAYAVRGWEIVVRGVGLPALAILALFVFERRPRMWVIVAGLLLAGAASIPFAIRYSALIDADKYELVLIWAVCGVIALACTSTITALERFGRMRIALVVTVLLVVSSAYSAYAQRGLVDARNDRNAINLVANVVRLTPDNAVVFAGWSYATPLAYAAYVEGSFGKRIVATNVAHDQYVHFKLDRPIYYLPFPEAELDIKDACLTLVPTSWPPLYRLSRKSSARCPSSGPKMVK